MRYSEMRYLLTGALILGPAAMAIASSLARSADTGTDLRLDRLPEEREGELPSLQNYRRARRALLLAIETIGRDAVLDFQNLEAAYVSEGLARGQSRTPGPPFDSTHASGRFLYEDGGRLYHEREFVNEGGTDRSFRRALMDEGSWNYWIARDLLSVVGPSDIAFQRARPELNMEKAFPHSLLIRALERPATIRFLGEKREGGRRIARVSFADRGDGVATLGIDLESGHPAFVERLGSDLLVGDAVNAVRFDEYVAFEGLAIPTRLTFTVNAEPIVRWALSDLRLNQSLDDDRFAPPEGVELADQPRRFTPIRVAPGVHVVRLYSGPANSYNTVLVEFADHVIVLEAPLVGAFYPVVRELAAAVAPGKPIGAVVTTHHHHDHLGGVLPFLAAGADVYAPPHAVAVLRTMLDAPHTIRRTPPVDGAAGRVIAISDSLVLSDGSRALRLLQVGPTPHVEQILVAHLPEERVLFVADLFAIPESRSFPPPSATFRRFAELVEEFELEFVDVVPSHGLVGTPADLDAALAR